MARKSKKPLGGKPPAGRRAGRREHRGSGGSGGGGVQIYGTHAVEAALKNPERPVHALYVTDNALERLAPAIAKRRVQPRKVGPKDLNHMLGGDAVHQGALLHTAPLPELELIDFVVTVQQPSDTQKLVVLLDQVTDPHNVGAILRSAAVFGARALIMTRRNSPPLSGTLAKAASGGLEHVPIIHVTNLARALEMIGEAGFDRLGLEGSGEFALEDETANRPIALVLGAEDTGLRRLTREACDRVCHLSTAGALESLNVSNAAAVALHTLRHLRSTQ